MNGHEKPCIINVEMRIQVPKVRKNSHRMRNSPLIANLRAPSQYLVLFCSTLQFSECVNTFSMDIELRNDRIPRNPFDRQFLDMREKTNSIAKKSNSIERRPTV